MLTEGNYVHVLPSAGSDWNYDLGMILWVYTGAISGSLVYVVEILEGPYAGTTPTISRDKLEIAA